MVLDAVRRETRVTLGTVTLPVTEYETACSVPAVRKTCIGGEPHTVLLCEIPCTLTLRGTLRRQDVPGISLALHDALAAHTAFDFALDEMQFAGMQLTDLHIKCQGCAQTADIAVTMIGGVLHADSL